MGFHYEQIDSLDPSFFIYKKKHENLPVETQRMEKMIVLRKIKHHFTKVVV